MKETTANSCMAKVFTYAETIIIRKVLPTIPSNKIHNNGQKEWGIPKAQEPTMMCITRSITADTWFYCISYGLMWFMIRVICIGGNAISNWLQTNDTIRHIRTFNSRLAWIASFQTAICINLLPMDLFKLSGC